MNATTAKDRLATSLHEYACSVLTEVGKLQRDTVLRTGIKTGVPLCLSRLQDDLTSLVLNTGADRIIELQATSERA